MNDIDQDTKTLDGHHQRDLNNTDAEVEADASAEDIHDSGAGCLEVYS